METLAYLHVSWVYEESTQDLSHFSAQTPLFLNPLGQRQFLRSGKLLLLSLLLSLSVLNLAQSVLALQRGDSGTEVTVLQTRLRDRGFFTGPITGFYGALTEDAVRRFQAANRLTVDGIAGANTVSVLQQAPVAAGGPALSQPLSTAGGTILRFGDTGAAVSNLQTRLRELGFYNGPITGYYGEITQDAVRRFQSANQLGVDGVAGPSTLRVIENQLSSQVPTAPRAQRVSRPAAQPLTTTPAVQPTAIGGPAIAVASPGRALQRGDSGAAVANLQTQLRAAGFYTGPITEYFGSLTEDAILRFQRSQGLTPDGIAGATTLAALQRAPRPTPAATPVTPAATPAATSATLDRLSVLELQRRLRARGFDPGPVDGNWGPRTQTAIAAAQRFYGVDSSSILSGRF